MNIDNILVLVRLDEDQLKKIKSVVPQAEIVLQKPKELTREQVERADIIVGNIHSEFLPYLKNTKLLQLLSSGVSKKYLSLHQTAPDCILCSASGAYGPAISEYMLAGLLMMMQRLHLYRDDRHKGEWKPREDARLLRDAKVLSVGMGDIGTSFGRLCSLLGAQVTGIRRRKTSPPPFIERIAGIDELDLLLPQMDVVALALPETAQTLGVMNRERFEAMKDGSYFMNVGRGSAVDQEALLWALRSGKLAGALIDVMDPEPLPPEHPLWQEERLMITPHISGQYHSQETQNELIELVCKNIEALKTGGEMTARVDFESGYRE
ncbi:MAG: D-2-hydroxyacid dehydrogenase [Clostridiales bacterium]|nr:D-2-hydroxyacid dehydrogenase [Clostridiales bacterium]